MDDTVEAFLSRLAEAVPSFADEADRETGFPSGALDTLRGIGALLAALPEAEGGLGLGGLRQGRAAARFFRLLGRASVSVGRLVEGHVNVVRLVLLLGDDRQREELGDVVRAGALCGIWVTDGDAPLRVADGVLRGGKAFCSGAGHVDRALVTAVSDRDRAPSLHLVEAAPGRKGLARPMSGVRDAGTADMALDGVGAGRPVGRPGDYLRQPEFSCGAWRGSAIACGALEALTAETIAALVGRGRHRNPHQAARLGRLLIARDTAILWVDRAAEAADGTDPAEAAATVNLARLAVEAACLEAIPLVQRSLGLSALMRGGRVERILRDLATYLRQPAPDETLTEAAIWFAERGA